METSFVAHPASLPPGTLVGSWRVVGWRAYGGFGVVYLAERVGHEHSGHFALKIARDAMDSRFEREVELLSRIRHPNVPRLHDSGHYMGPDDARFPYLVMDWIEGVALYEWARLHPLTSRQALRLLAQVGRALQATHAVGGLHRDLKGDNILVRTQDAWALLMDFGSGTYPGARALTRHSPPPYTPQYASPEARRFHWRWRRQPSARYAARPADDVYALGVTAYRLVTGRYPLTEHGSKWEEAMSDTPLSLAPPAPADSLVLLCPELARLIRQMLSDRPSARGSTAEVAEALEYAAEKAGLSADRLITPHVAQVSSSRTAWLSLARRFFPRRRGLLAAAAIVTLIASAWSVVQWQTSRLPGAVADDGSAEGKSVGLAADALTQSGNIAKPVPSRGGIGLDMPKGPLHGQRRAPCEKPEIEINAGCWWLLANATPPCGKRAYAWKNRCYFPSFEPPRPATSEQP